MGKIPEVSVVHNGLVEGTDGLIYIGTGLNELMLLNLSKEIPYGRRMIENQLWEDIKSKYEGYEGGRIFVYNPKEGDGQVYLPEDHSSAQDLGIAVPGNSIYAMAISRKDKILENLTPSYSLEYDIHEKPFKIM